MTDRRQIVAMGGGGFMMEPQNPLLDDHALAASGADNPRVCFVPTAAGDADSAIVRFYQAFPSTRCRPSHLPLVKSDAVPDRRSLLLDQDVIYVGGGNTVVMLAVWRAFGVDAILRDAWEAGIVLCGVSAGANCWFETGTTDVFGEMTALEGCLGFLPGSHCP